jgi:D-beta-D-heptose 7-phosphate kinase/D-beta-D-heptose 1-phosphate adenosyltransferase
VNSPVWLVERFRGLRAVVVGDAILDSYVAGSSRRLSQEAPVPVVDVLDQEDAPGGAANAAANAAALGASVLLLTAVGDDEPGRRLRSLLAERGVDPSQVLAVRGRPTLTKTRVAADGHALIRLDRGATDDVDGETERSVVERLAALHGEADAVIVSDYGYGVLTRRVIATLADAQGRDPRVLVVDAKLLDAYRQAGVTAVKPNFGQAVRLLGDTPNGDADRAREIEAGADRLLDATGARIVAGLRTGPTLVPGPTSGALGRVTRSR